MLPIDTSSSSVVYRAFGLTIASVVELPELPHAAGEPEVVIRWGSVPPMLNAPDLCSGHTQVRGGDWLVAAEHKAGTRFLIRNGREVVVDRVRPADNELLRLFLLGSCMGAVLMQRGLLPLHANTVVRDGAVIIGGVIGAGKSSLTAALMGRGYQLLADDLTAIRLEPGSLPGIVPGFAQLKLWSDTIKRLRLDTGRLSRLRPELPKYRVPVDGAFCARAQRIRAIYLLKPAPVELPVLYEVTGMQKLRELQQHLYKLDFSVAQQIWPWLFPAIAVVAAQAPVRIVERPTHDFLLDELAELIERDLKA